MYNKTHCMDELSVAEIAERVKENAHFQVKYDARYQRGDIVEVRADGYWSKDRAGHGKHAFALVVLPGLSIEDAQHYMDAHEDMTDPEKPILPKRRKHQMDMAQMSLNAEKIVTITNISDAHITDKSTVVING